LYLAGLDEVHSIETRFLELRNGESAAIVRGVKDEVERGNGVQVDVHIKMIAALDGNGYSFVSLGCVGIVGGRIGNVEGMVHNNRGRAGVGLRRGWMNSVPGFCAHRNR
jgi:hypothetical protein